MARNDKFQVEITTHAAYSFAVNTRIVPYFREKGIYLKELQPKHLHDFYQYVSYRTFLASC
ncbi:hypothetical protein [Paenibacillus thiaminolyticus]|uniref:hypothetical protein n=1 Tax=Paenibacillus thiaminolyticus TaxID=49283 RepID=UPI003D2AF0C7